MNVSMDRSRWVSKGDNTINRYGDMHLSQFHSQWHGGSTYAIIYFENTHTHPYPLCTAFGLNEGVSVSKVLCHVQGKGISRYYHTQEPIPLSINCTEQCQLHIYRDRPKSQADHLFISSTP